MKKLIYITSLIVLLFFIGCGDDSQPRSSSVQPVSEYKKLLEKRVDSVDGANINIRKEVSRYENASDEDKRSLYKKVEDIVNGK